MSDRLRHPPHQPTDESVDTLPQQDDAIGMASTMVAKRLATADPLSRGLEVGRYIILEPLGAGAMGVVYSAYDPSLDRRVALKLLRTESPTLRSRERLLREAQLLAQVDHPNVVAVHDVGTHSDGVFIAMELIAGETFGQWLDREQPPFRQVLDVLHAAGRGLAAAHAKGVVHRDFKPDNLVIGDNGRVRVVDFGLARVASSDGESQDGELTDTQLHVRLEVHSPADIDTGPRKLLSPLTVEGELMGTPGYMAPEQYASDHADELSDQFNFGATLYEALFGERPFMGETLNDYRRHTLSGATTPNHSRVPAALRRVTLRCLQTRPADRYPTMSSALRDLARAGRPRWRLPAAVAGVVTVVAAIAVLFALSGDGSAPAVCESAGKQIDEAWNPARQSAVHATFMATRAPYAAAASTGVQRRVTAYAKTWAATHRDICEATHVHREQSEQAMDLRMACMEERRRDLDALVGVFANADREIVRHAIEATAELPPITDCNRVATLQRRVTLPSDPSLRKRADELRRQLVQVTALRRAGKYAEGLAIAEQLGAKAQQLDWLPLQAEAWFEIGDLQIRTGAYKDATNSLDDALSAAEASGHDQVSALALLRRVEALTMRERMEPARYTAKLADGKIRRLGDPYQLRAELSLRTAVIDVAQARFDEAIEHSLDAIEKLRGGTESDALAIARVQRTLGQALFRAGRLPEAQKILREAITTTEREHGPDHPDLALALGALAVSMENTGPNKEREQLLRRELAITEGELGPTHPRVADALSDLAGVASGQRRYDEAQKMLRRALAIYEHAFGPTHTSVGTVLINLGFVALEREQFLPALEHLERALAINEAGLVADHPDLAYDLVGIGAAKLGLGRHKTAIVTLERALSITDGNKGLLAEIQFALSRALWSTPRNRVRARKLALAARATYAENATVYAVELAKLDRWVTQHGGLR